MAFSEKDIISFIIEKSSSPGVVVGAGKDDCACVSIGGKKLLLTSDIMFRSSHFPSALSLQSIARKAVVANISDLASMGSKPLYILLSLGIPRNYPHIRPLTQGFKATCKEYNTMIIGGDTKCSKELTISITAIGEARHNLLLRSNARAGDVIAVTGGIGSAFCGFHSLLNNKRTPHQLAGSFTHPKARVKEGMLLSKLPRAAAMDITDGLLYTASEISNASKVRIDIDSKLIPIPEPALAYSKKHNIPFKKLINTGEDYELLVSLSGRDFRRLKRKANLTRIGSVEKGKDLFLDGKKTGVKGYDAFG
ncbi:MAG: thiamine-phosphate kinase [Candidatus Micrarchaeota archaeon]